MFDIHNTLNVLSNDSFRLMILRFLTGQQVLIKNKWYHHMIHTCFGDHWLVESQLGKTFLIIIWLAEAWVKQSSQRIIRQTISVRLQWPLHYQRNESIPGSWKRLTGSGITESKQPRKTYQRQSHEVLQVRFDLIRYETTAQMLRERRRELE